MSYIAERSKVNSDLCDLFIKEYNVFGFYSFKKIDFSKWLTF